MIANHIKLEQIFNSMLPKESAIDDLKQFINRCV
jgi:hypothetical protein